MNRLKEQKNGSGAQAFDFLETKNGIRKIIIIYLRVFIILLKVR